TSGVNALCAFTIRGRALLASAGYEGIHVWDPFTGELYRTIEDRITGPGTVCAVNSRGRVLLATTNGNSLFEALADLGGTIPVNVWDVETGEHQGVSEGPLNEQTLRIPAVCAFTSNGRTLLATVSRSADVRIWDLDTRKLVRTLVGHSAWVGAICSYTSNGRTLLATASDDGTIRTWDPDASKRHRAHEYHSDWVRTICSYTEHGHTLLATAGDDLTIRIWDADTGNGRTVISSPGWAYARGILVQEDLRINDVCAFDSNGRTLLAAGYDDYRVRIFDSNTGHVLHTLKGHKGGVKAVCAINVHGRTLLASAAGDTTVRVWDADTGQHEHTLKDPSGLWGKMTAFLLRDTTTQTLCAYFSHDRVMLATTTADRKVAIWDPSTGLLQRTLAGHEEWVQAVCAFTLGGRTLLATASNRTIHIWDADTGRKQHKLEGHTAWVTAVCAFTLNGRPLLATASNDKTIRVWDPQTGAVHRVIPVQHVPTALTWVQGRLAVALWTGLLVLQPLTTGSTTPA
ncbi:WD40 repeat domain-containing protein, partial [Microbispora sp. ZYX-F-249]